LDQCAGAKNGIVFRHLYIKIMILPRQARDKHRENSKKETVLSQDAIVHVIHYDWWCELKNDPVLFFVFDLFSGVCPEPVLANN